MAEPIISGNYTLTDERCPECGLKKWCYQHFDDYYECIFCGFKQKGTTFFSPEIYGGDDFCIPCDKYKNGKDCPPASDESNNLC